MKIRNLKLSSILAALPILLTACGTEKTGNDVETYRNVILTIPQSTAASETQSYAGIIEEGKNINASFMADGRIARMMVKEGDRVRKGQTLAVLDDTDYQLGVNQLMAQYRQMTEEKKRLDEMYARHNVAPNDYEKMLAGYEQLELQLKLAQNKLDYTRLESPADGYIATRFMEPGELVGAGTPIFKIIDDSKLVATVDLPVSAYLNRGAIGNISGQTSATGHEAVPLKMESFTPDADNSMLYHMRLAIPASFNRTLFPGMHINVNIEFENNDNGCFLIPSRAIFSNGSMNSVWVYNAADSTITARTVEVNGTPVDNLSAVKGVSAADRIVAAGVKQLREGEKVAILDNPDFTGN